MRSKIIFKSVGLCYLLVVVVAFAVMYWLKPILPFNFQNGMLIALGGAIPVAILMYAVIWLIGINDPYFKLQKEFLNEFFTNGYTAKFFELGGKGITAYKNGKKVNKAYLFNFVFYISDYYNLVGDYERSRELLSLLDVNDFSGMNTRSQDNGQTALLYYLCMFEMLRGTGNKAEAMHLFERIKPFLDSKNGTDPLSRCAKSILFNFYMLMEDYDMARKTCDIIGSMEFADDSSKLAYYYLKADLEHSTGRDEEAVAALIKTKQIFGRESRPVCVTMYDFYLKKLELEDAVNKALAK